MTRTDNTIVSAASLLTSLLFYFYAREAKKDTGPYVMIGAFVGSMIGEVAIDTFKTNP